MPLISFLFGSRASEDDSAEFEKRLATIADRLHNIEARLLKAHARRRKYKGIVTLYLLLLWSIFAVSWIFWFSSRKTRFDSWILSVLVLIFGPFIIYLLRQAIDKYYLFKINNLTIKLKEAKKEIEINVEELKAKRKFHSTQEIIDRYTVTDSSSSTIDGLPKDLGSSSSFAALNDRPLSPQARKTTPRKNQESINLRKKLSPQSKSPSTEYPTITSEIKNPPIIPQRTWMDRILDLVVGQDENAPSSRDALICKNCFAHNGLAPIASKASSVRYFCPNCRFFNGSAENDNKKDESNAVKKLDDKILTKHTDSSSGLVNSQKDPNADTVPDTVPNKESKE